VIVLSNDNRVLSFMSKYNHFNRSYFDEFRKTYETHDTEKITQYNINLDGTDYLDSSALGMLLVLRDFAGGDDSNIVIQNCSEEVQKIFSISSFTQLFTIQ